MNANMTIVYRNDTKQVINAAYSNVTEIDLAYDSETESTLKMFHIPGVTAYPTRYFYVGGQVIEYGLGRLSLSCDVSTLPADGTSVATYTVSKVDGNGDPMTGASDNETISISCSRGSLSTISTDLVNGSATFTLTSVTETVPIRVEVSCETLGPASKVIQLVP